MVQSGTQPFISVLVPTLNSGASIVSCIESIRKCDSQNYEIIVVDVRSNDKTPRLASACGATVIEGNGKGRAGDPSGIPLRDRHRLTKSIETQIA